MNEIVSVNFTVLPPCLYEMVCVALAGTTLLVAVVVVVPELGFTEGGVEAESAASAFQATIGDVEKESLFAMLQSLAARGQLLVILKNGLPVVGGLAVACEAFCGKIKEIEGTSVEAAVKMANVTSAVLEHVERAATDSKAIEQLRNAAEGAAKSSKDVFDHVADQTKTIWDDIWHWIANHIP